VAQDAVGVVLPIASKMAKVAADVVLPAAEQAREVHVHVFCIYVYVRVIHICICEYVCVCMYV
jgi:hypothetical protein